MSPMLTLFGSSNSQATKFDMGWIKLIGKNSKDAEEKPRKYKR